MTRVNTNATNDMQTLYAQIRAYTTRQLITSPAPTEHTHAHEPHIRINISNKRNTKTQREKHQYVGDLGGRAAL